MTDPHLPQSGRTLLADLARALDTTAGGYQAQARAIRAYLVAADGDDEPLAGLPELVTVVSASVTTGERRYEVKG